MPRFEFRQIIRHVYDIASSRVYQLLRLAWDNCNVMKILVIYVFKCEEKLIYINILAVIVFNSKI